MRGQTKSRRRRLAWLSLESAPIMLRSYLAHRNTSHVVLDMNWGNPTFAGDL
jgi:hypothetical protein